MIFPMESTSFVAKNARAALAACQQGDAWRAAVGVLEAGPAGCSKNPWGKWGFDQPQKFWLVSNIGWWWLVVGGFKHWFSMG